MVDNLKSNDQSGICEYERVNFIKKEGTISKRLLGSDIYPLTRGNQNSDKAIVKKIHQDLQGPSKIWQDNPNMQSNHTSCDPVTGAT